MTNIDEVTRSACLEIGVVYKLTPSDGRFHPVNLIDDSRGKGDGRLKLFPDHQGGIVWNHKTGERQVFFINQKRNNELTPEERARIQAEQMRRQKDLQNRQNKAALRAYAIWQHAKPAAANHPYLIKKLVRAHGARVAAWHRTIVDDKGQHRKLSIENALLIPLYNESGRLRNLQSIFPSECLELGRGKDFLPGGETAGLFWWIGEKTDTVCLCEGFATAATVHQETGLRVYVCFMAGNLSAVGQVIRKHLLKEKLIFCADNDLSGIGLEKATQAAQSVDGLVCIPPLQGMDFNDYARHLLEAS